MTPGNGGRIEVSGYYYDGLGVNVLAEYQNLVNNSQGNNRGNNN
ncbi:hypothetical protein [Natronospora cellulosivora (SeqCode)]